jgi:predicted transcriptional regulator of viral defense system
MVDQNRNVRNWIEDLPKKGRLTFSMNEVQSMFSYMPKETLRSVISRLKKKERVCSVWRGFYLVVPDEYGLRGIVPPVEYIDYLMRHLDCEYYVGLLSAAAFQGAAHQQPQSLMVVTDSNDLKDSIKGDTAIRFVSKSEFPHPKYLYEKNSGWGKVVMSCPELTSLDLIAYEKSIGGLERAACVLEELSEVLNYENTDVDLWKNFPRQVIQRLGFILEKILTRPELSEAVFRKSQDTGITFRKALLAPQAKDSNSGPYDFNTRWKLVINVKMEVDV